MNKFQIFLVLTCILVSGLSIAYVLVIVISNKRIIKLQQARLLDIRKNEQRYKALFENSIVGMVIFDPIEWQVLDANQSLFVMLDVTVTLEVQDYLRSIPKSIKEGIESSLREKGYFEDQEIHYTTHKGRSRIFLLSGRRNDGDMMVHAICIDITEKKRLEDAYLRAQKMEAISLLTNSLAHDLQNILAPILLSVRLLYKQVKTKHGRRILKATAASANDGLKLIEKILSFGKRVKIERKGIDLSLLIDRSIVVFNQNMSRLYTISSSIKESSLFVRGDELQLRQALLNLLFNARDAMPHGGKIMIEVDHYRPEGTRQESWMEDNPEKFVSISISDNGRGIPKANIDKIFEPFFTTKGDLQGTGLGLSIVESIIKNHGGAITVRSRIHKGTTFTIVLPLAENT